MTYYLQIIFSFLSFQRKGISPLYLSIILFQENSQETLEQTIEMAIDACIRNHILENFLGNDGRR